MYKFTCAADIGDLHIAVAEALEIKRDRYQFTGLGRNKTLLMLFSIRVSARASRRRRPR